MSEPKLRIKASGYSGSGYFQPFTGERLIGVTTALGVIDKPGLRQWAVDQTAAWAALNAEQLQGMEEEQRYKMLRFYHSRFKSEHFDDPMIDIRNAHVGVLDDASNLGTKMHDLFEAETQGWIEPDLYRDEELQMAEQLYIWLAENDIELFAAEATLFGQTEHGLGFGGTADFLGLVNGVPTCLDLKTSRSTWDTHFAQLSALGATHTMAKEVPKGTPGAVEYTATVDKVKRTSYWVPAEVPPISQYAVLRLRPDDVDSKGLFKPAFCELKIVSQEMIEAGWRLFQGSVYTRHAQRDMKQLEKEEKNG